MQLGWVKLKTCGYMIQVECERSESRPEPNVPVRQRSQYSTFSHLIRVPRKLYLRPKLFSPKYRIKLPSFTAVQFSGLYKQRYCLSTLDLGRGQVEIFFSHDQSKVTLSETPRGQVSIGTGTGESRVGLLNPKIICLGQDTKCDCF